MARTLFDKGFLSAVSKEPSFVQKTNRHFLACFRLIPQSARAVGVFVFAFLLLFSQSVFAVESAQSPVDQEMQRLSELHQKMEDLQQTQKHIVEVGKSRVEIGAFQAEYSKQAEKLADEVQTLQQVLDGLQSQKEEIQATLETLAQKNTELQSQKQDLDAQVVQKEDEIRRQKAVTVQIIQVLRSRLDESFVESLLKYDTFGTALVETQELSDVEKEAERLFTVLQKLQTELKDKQNEVIQKQNDLKLVSELTLKKQAELEENRAAQEGLLAQTKWKQESYEELAQAAQKAQADLEQEMKSMMLQVDTIQKELSAEQAKILEAQKNRTITDFDWPVSPERGLTAYFHDPVYKRLWGFRHDAIDIRVGQGSDILAPADGVVRKVGKRGDGYWTLAVAHPWNIYTVYGHVSAFNVKEWDIVKRGTVIAKTGGMPKVLGSGPYSSGPHLHFEVWEMQDGEMAPVDPLNRLNLLLLPFDSVPANQYKRLAEQKDTIKR